MSFLRGDVDGGKSHSALRLRGESMIGGRIKKCKPAVIFSVCLLLRLFGCASVKESMDRKGVEVDSGKVVKVYKF